jgi:hypothetical protein
MYMKQQIETLIKRIRFGINYMTANECLHHTTQTRNSDYFLDLSL